MIMGSITYDITNYVFVCVTIATLIIYIYMTRNYNFWKKRGIKEVSPSFLFGNVGPCIFARQTPTDLLFEIYQKGEDTVIGFHVMDKPFLMVRDPELIRHIFIRDFANFSNKLLAGDEKDVLGNASLFMVKNPPWKYIRQKLTPIFTSGKLKKMFDLMLEIREDLQIHLENLNIDGKTGKIIEVRELCAKFTTDLIGTTAFGMQLNSLKDPDAEFRKYGREMFRAGYKRYLQMLAIMFVPQLRFLTKPKFFDEKGTNFLRESFWYAIDQRMKTGIRRNDLIDLLIDIRKKQDIDVTDTYKLEGDEIVAQAAIFFSGGFETSSLTMTFSLYELAINPEIQRKLRNEISNAMEETNGKITYDMLTTLPYLDMVVHEVLRKYPTLPWLDRLPEEDYTFSGTDVSILKGTPMILPTKMIQMDPKYFPDPEKFDPERFSQENKKNITPGTYFPFGEGPRNCIAGRLGLIQTKLGIVHFIHNYEVTPCDQTLIPMRFEKLYVVTHPSGGVFLNFKKFSH